MWSTASLIFLLAKTPSSEQLHATALREIMLYPVKIAGTAVGRGHSLWLLVKKCKRQLMFPNNFVSYLSMEFCTANKRLAVREMEHLQD